jgi:hypothetical protein
MIEETAPLTEHNYKLPDAVEEGTINHRKRRCRTPRFRTGAGPYRQGELS